MMRPNSRKGLNCDFAHGHGASIGSLGAHGSPAHVGNVTFRRLVFNRTTSTMRIKTWQGGHGLVNNITYEDIQVVDVGLPILITQYYCPRSQHPAPCKNESGVVRVANVAIRNVAGTHLSDGVAGEFLCSDTPGACANLSLSNVSLSNADGEPADRFVCWKAHGTAVDVHPPACFSSR